MNTKLEIAQNWLPRYTGTQIDEFGDYLLITNFNNYVTKFAEKFNCNVQGEGKPMQTATNNDTPITAGPNAPTTAICPACGGAVVLRKRKRMDGETTYFYRHKQGQGEDCPHRYRPT